MNTDYVKKLGAYALAAGAATVVGNATTAQASMVMYDNGGAGWYDIDNDWNQDLITFKMDGTVVTNSGDIAGLQVLGQDDDSFTFSERDFYWWGTEEKDATCLNVGANVGYVGGVADVWNVGRLGTGYWVGSSLAGDRVWSDDTVTDTGGLGGWNFYFAGEWPFGGAGYIGLYADDIDGRHYGWANVNMTAYNAMELIEFGFESEVDTPAPTPEPMTLSMLVLGATGLLARRKRA